MLQPGTVNCAGIQRGAVAARVACLRVEARAAGALVAEGCPVLIECWAAGLAGSSYHTASTLIINQYSRTPFLGTDWIGQGLCLVRCGLLEASLGVALGLS